jgi:hypothetical protein
MRRFWTKREIAVIRREYPHKDTARIAKRLKRSRIACYQRAQILGLKKSAAYMKRQRALERARLQTAGVPYRFGKGHVPANAGLRRPGYSPGRMSETQFKKGNRPHTWMPIGSHRYSKEGYLQQKVTDTGYPPRDWVAVHILLWIEANGPVPPGHAVSFKDKDKTHIVLDNLELISRGELMKRNSYHYNYPKEIGELIQLRGAVQRQINRRERHAKQD